MAAKIALAVFTAQQEWQNNPIGTLEKIKEMGYEGVELGLHGDDDHFKAIKNKLDELNLTATSTHSMFDDLLINLDMYLDRMKQLNMKYLMTPWMPRECIPGGSRYEEQKAKIRYVAERCEIEGIKYHFHNHNFEFEKVNGVNKLDIMLQDIPELYIQFDVCWCVVGGQDPAQYIRHYGHRAPTVHMKDFNVPGRPYGNELADLFWEVEGEHADITRERGGFKFQPLGYGQVDFQPVYEAADEVGVDWFIVEQDNSPERPPMEDIKISIDFLKSTYLANKR